MSGERTDHELIELIALKDARALELLYDRYERPMFSFAYRFVKDTMAAEEIVQELFLRIWNSAERFQVEKGKVSTWMFTVTRNVAIDLLRKRSRKFNEPVDDKIMMRLTNDSNTEQEVESKWVDDQVKAALYDLSKDQQQVVEWIYFKGYTQQEVSEIHEIPLGTVKSRVRLALKQLKLRLGRIDLFGNIGSMGRREYEHE